MHWRKSMSERAGLGGLSTDAPATLGSYAPSDSNSIPPEPIFHSEDVCDPPLDVVGVIRDALLGSITGVALAVSVFILLFVRV
jgi:hypothetical protein